MPSFALDDTQQLLLTTVRKFAASSLRPNMRTWEKSGEIPAATRRAFDELGVTELDFAESVGGSGPDLPMAALVHEALAHGDPAAAISLWTPHLFAHAVSCLGDDEQQQRWLPRFIAGRGSGGAIGAVAYSEPKGAIEGFATSAERTEDGYVLNGHKAFVVNGGIADLTIVFAQLSDTSGWDGAAAFVVEKGRSGFTAGARYKLLGLEAVHAAEVQLANCLVPEENRLRVINGGDFLAATRSLLARISVVNAARQVGLMRAAYEQALEYTQERKAFGKPVAHFQANAFSLAEMLMDLESSRDLVWQAARAVAQGELRPAAEALIMSNAAAWRVADQAVQLFGGAGFVKDFPVEKWLRDTKALALFGPPSEVAASAVASSELGHPIGTGLPSTGLQPFFT